MRFSWQTLAAGVVVALVAFGVAQPRAAWGQTFTWNNATGNWATGASWVGGVAPGAIGVAGTSIVYGADTLVFGDAGVAYTATNDISDAHPNRRANFMINQLNITNAVNGSQIVGSAFPNLTRLEFTGPSATVNMTGTGNFNLDHTLQVLDNFNLAVNVAPGAGQLRLGRAPGTTTNSELYGTGTITITNNSSNAVLLSNSDPFAGTLSIAAGTVQLSQTGTSFIFPTATVNVAAGATFNMNNHDDQIGALTGGGTVQLGTAYLSFQQIIDQDWSGSITNTPGTHLVSPNQPTIHKDFRSRESTMTWRGNNTYTGETNIYAGTFKLVDGGRISGTSDSADDVDDNGLTIYNSTMILDNTGTANNNDRVNDLAPIKLAGTLSLLGRAGTASSETLDILTLGVPVVIPEQGSNVFAAGPSTINVVKGAGGTATLNLAKLTREGTRGTTVNFSGDGTVNITIVPDLYNGVIGGWATYGNEWATMSGNTVVPLASYQTGSNPAAWAATDNVKITGAPSANVAANQTINTLNFASNQTLTVDGGQTLTVGTGGILASTSGNITGGSLAAGTVSGGFEDLKVRVNGAGSTLTIDSTIVGGATSLTKTGDGTLVLTAANTFASNGLGNGVNFQEGVLQVSASNQLGTWTGVTPATVTNPTLLFSGGTLKLGADLDLRPDVTQTARGITSVGPRGMVVDTNGFTLQTTSVGGYGGIVKKGAGTWILNVTNSFDGDVYIEGGTLQAPSGSVAANSLFDPTTIVHISPGATFDFNDHFDSNGMGGIEGSGTINLGVAATTNLNLSGTQSQSHIMVFNGVIQGAGNVIIDTFPFKQSFGGASTYAGTTTISSGGIIVTANALASADGPLGNAATAVVVGTTGTSNNVVTSLETGAAGVTIGRDVLVERGTETVIGGVHTTGSSTFSGLVTLRKTPHIQALGTSTVSFTGNIVDFGVGSAATGGLVKIGSGTVILSGAGNLYSGGTLVADGTLLVNGTNGGAGAVIVASDGTLGGTGSIAGPVTVYGTLAPGASVGTLTVSNNVAINGTMSVEVSGTSIDLLAVTGNLTLGGSSVLDIQGNLATALTHVIATFTGSLTGTFGNALDATTNGYNVVYDANQIILDELDGDANHDGLVNIFDINLVSANWNPAGPVAAFAPGNINHDTVVDIFDINQISANWAHVATNGGPAHAQAVPEPSSLVIALAGVLGLVGLRRLRHGRRA